MPTRMGQAFWPGVKGFISCSYTVSHDAGAGVAALEIPEQDVTKIRSFGSLVITDGFGTVTLRNCRISDISFSASPTGARTIVLSIVDRRWMWRYGTISGNWNQLEAFPDPDLFPPGQFVINGGPYAPGTYRSAHLLMVDCIREMGEQNLPLIDPAPAIPVPVQWDDELPASALSSLCASLGYRLVYQPVADRVLIAPAGTGKPLPINLPTVTASATLDLPERPNTIGVSGGPTIFNDTLALEPVGPEKSGIYVPIDELSYKPAAGWATQNPVAMWGAQATPLLTAEEARDLARRHVWRTFRVKMVDVANGASPRLVVPNYGQVYDRKQIVLLPQHYQYVKQLNGQLEAEPAYAMGKVYVANGTGVANVQVAQAFGHTVRGKRLPWKPAIDGARGLVTFDRQMFELNNNTYFPPELFVYTGFHVRSIVGRVFAKFVWGRTLAGLVNLGCPAEVLKHSEMVLISRTVRADADFAILTTGDNVDELGPLADYYIRAANAKYGLGAAGDITLAGIVPIDPDGALQQVTWTVGGGSPATTRVSRNTEHASYLPSFPERRRNEDLRRFVAVAANAAQEANGPAPPPREKKYISQFPPPPGGY